MNSKQRQQNFLIDGADSSSCYICGKTDWGLQYHHTSYKPEMTVRVCSSCHGEIHSNESEYEHLKPDRERPENYNTIRNRTEKIKQKLESGEAYWDCYFCDGQFVKSQMYPVKASYSTLRDSVKYGKEAWNNLYEKLNWCCYRCKGKQSAGILSESTHSSDGDEK